MVTVDARVEKAESVVGVNVSVRVDEPTVAVTTVPPGGKGTLEDCGPEEAPGRTDGA